MTNETKKIGRGRRLISYCRRVLGMGSDGGGKPECPMTFPGEGKPIQCRDLPFASCEECLKGQGLEEVGKRAENLVAISELKEKNSGKVAFIRGGNKKLRRLLDMGLTPNTVVSVVRAAPLGGPVEIAVRGSRLALGRGIASDVFVEVIKGSGKEEG